MNINHFLKQHRLPDTFITSIHSWFIPLADEIQQLVAQQNEKPNATQPLFIGINGCQGSGKSTLVSFLVEYLSRTHQFNAVNISLDDYYLSREKRNELAKTEHPLLATRGVPGTHDIDALRKCLMQLALGKEVRIPKFNKAIDDLYPEQCWTHVTNTPDIVFIEGWCWGVLSQANLLLTSPINEFEACNDKEGVWRQYVNRCLRENYEPLYQYMNKWIMLKAPSFEHVLEWRWQQEQSLLKAYDDKKPNLIMNKAQLAHFIAYFQRLTEHSLLSLPKRCDLVFELNNNRVIQQKRGTLL